MPDVINALTFFLLVDQNRLCEASMNVIVKGNMGACSSTIQLNHHQHHK